MAPEAVSFLRSAAQTGLGIGYHQNGGTGSGTFLHDLLVA